MTLNQLLKDLTYLKLKSSSFGEYYKKDTESSNYLTNGVKKCLNGAYNTKVSNRFGIRERDF